MRKEWSWDLFTNAVLWLIIIGHMSEHSFKSESVRWWSIGAAALLCGLSIVKAIMVRRGTWKANGD